MNTERQNAPVFSLSIGWANVHVLPLWLGLNLLKICGIWASNKEVTCQARNDYANTSL